MDQLLTGILDAVQVDGILRLSDYFTGNLDCGITGVLKNSAGSDYQVGFFFEGNIENAIFDLNKSTTYRRPFQQDYYGEDIHKSNYISRITTSGKNYNGLHIRASEDPRTGISLIDYNFPVSNREPYESVYREYFHSFVRTLFYPSKRYVNIIKRP